MKTIHLENEFLEIELLSLGATLLSFKHKKDQQNIVLRYYDTETYRNDPGPYLGASIGPTAGRIAGGEYLGSRLRLNSGSNHLHGGNFGINTFDFSVETFGQTKVVFSGCVDHTKDFYPSSVRYEICYELKGESLILTLQGIPEKEMYLNLTNHSYFNLDGSATIANHHLKIASTVAGLLNASLAYQGEWLDVKGTILDFSLAPALKTTLEGHHEQFAYTRNLDHFYPVSELVLSTDQKSLKIETDAPGFQVYAGNYFDESFKDEEGRGVVNHAALAIEPQRAANEPNFSTDFPLASAAKPFKSKSVYTLEFIEKPSL